jgi:hypothetical protein
MKGIETLEKEEADMKWQELVWRPLNN